MAALGIVGGNISIGNATTAAAPIAKKRPSTSTLGTIAINDIIATRTHPTPVSDGQVTVSIGNQDTQKNPITTGRIGYGTCYNVLLIYIINQAKMQNTNCFVLLKKFAAVQP